jgi:hypothetical protein
MSRRKLPRCRALPESRCEVSVTMCPINVTTCSVSVYNRGELQRVDQPSCIVFTATTQQTGNGDRKVKSPFCYVELAMLKLSDMRRLVDLQQCSYLLLKWLAQAVSEGVISFATAHKYSTLPEAAEKWILEHYMNIPEDARPLREELPVFCAFFSTYLTNSFDLRRNPGIQLYSAGAHCFCPMCSWVAEAPRLKAKKLTRIDKNLAQTMRINVLLNMAAKHGLTLGEGEIEAQLEERHVFVDASLVAYGHDLLQREKGIANGPAVLALWRGFAWNESGSPKPNFRLRGEMILDADHRLLQLLGAK